MNDLTVDDLMGQDYLLYAHLESNGYVTVQIADEDENIVFDETTHPYAWESLVYFAKQVIDCDIRLQEVKAIKENNNGSNKKEKMSHESEKMREEFSEALNNLKDR